ncbi:MAG TPA: hypothetical protein VF625_08820, partial [Longimicrobium sp.]
HDDAWLRQQIQSILDEGWPADELAEIGITRALLARLGFRDDRPDLFAGPERAGIVPPPRRPDPGAGSSPDAAEAAFSRGRDAASSFSGDVPGGYGAPATAAAISGPCSLPFSMKILFAS